MNGLLTKEFNRKLLMQFTKKKETRRYRNIILINNFLHTYHSPDPKFLLHYRVRHWTSKYMGEKKKYVKETNC